MSKYTPGPWEFDVSINDHGGWRNREQIIRVWAEATLVADYSTSSVEYPSDEENKANARLIAKSPEMLDMLIQCRKEFAGLPHSLGYDFTHLPKLDALIAEATGEQA